MSRISAKFAALKKQQRKAIVTYITAGDPNPDATVPLLHGLVESGADILELGVPFSDPIADGSVIQLACERALAHHISLSDILKLVKEFRQQDNETPIVLMGYMNPIEAMGSELFVKEAKNAGVDGVLIVDLPPEEARDLVSICRVNAIDTVFLLAPTTTVERSQKICQQVSGYVYYVALKGVTGAKNLDTGSVQDKLASIREVTDLPICVGFGIKDAKIAKTVAELADGIVIGSLLINQIAEHAKTDSFDIMACVEAVSDIIKSLRQALDN